MEYLNIRPKDVKQIYLHSAFYESETKEKIQKISGNDKVRQHLLELGLVTGAVVTVVSSENDNVILAVGESRVAVGADLARRIMV